MKRFVVRQPSEWMRPLRECIPPIGARGDESDEVAPGPISTRVCPGDGRAHRGFGHVDNPRIARVQGDDQGRAKPAETPVA